MSHVFCKFPSEPLVRVCYYFALPPELKFTVDHNVMYRLIARQRLGKYIPAEAYAPDSRSSIARQRIRKQASTIERLCFLRGLCLGVIKGQRRSFESVVVELVVKKMGRILEMAVECD
jgi:hypothetical protein